MSSFRSSILYSLILAGAGYFIISLIGPSLPQSAIFAAGLLIGGVFIAIKSNPSEKTPTTAKTASTPDAEKVSGPTKTIYVGNLPYRANEVIIKELFERYGFVHSVRLLKDRQTGKRRGFGFVEMEEAAGEKAISALNESDFQQRTLKVREAKDRPEKEESNEFQAQS
jgi:RNA recognition motif-containing protein